MHPKVRILHMRAAQDLAKGDRQSLHGFWLAKQCSAGAVYPIELRKNKIANRKAAIIQPNNALDHKRNKNAVASVRRLNFLVVKI